MNGHPLDALLNYRVSVRVHDGGIYHGLFEQWGSHVDGSVAFLLVGGRMIQWRYVVVIEKDTRRR